jgi:hypothetical protein
VSLEDGAGRLGAEVADLARQDALNRFADERRREAVDVLALRQNAAARAAPASARSSGPASSIDASRQSTPCSANPIARSRFASRAMAIGVRPRRFSSRTTKRPVCPAAPSTATIRAGLASARSTVIACPAADLSSLQGYYRTATLL